jgi:hypothetical protein
MRRVSILVAAAGVACGAGACTLLESLDGFSGGADAGEGGSAVDANDERPISTQDGGASDALVTADAPVSRYPAAVLADNPILYYRFGETSGMPARDEISGTTVPYPVTGIAYGYPGPLAGDTNTAIKTDGSGSILLSQASAEFDGLAPFSVEAWVSPASNGNDLGFLVDHEDWSGNRHGWLVRASKSDYGLERWSGGLDGAPPSASVQTLQTAVNGEWHYFVVTFDGTTERLYLDGIRRTESSLTIPVPKTGVPFSVGKQNCLPCAANSFVGVIDELAIYPKALSEDRILAHLTAGK